MPKWNLKRLASAVLATLSMLVVAGVVHASDDGYVLYLSKYLDGDYYVAPLGDVDVAKPRVIRPKKLRFPKRFRSLVLIGNQDVSPNGRNIVFAASRKADWDIYTGVLDLDRSRITDVVLLIKNSFGNDPTRDEDPRYSWDGSQIVYKCAFDICIYDQQGEITKVAESPCELWAPSFDPSGYWVSYAKRGDEMDGGCDDDPQKDRIWVKNLQNQGVSEFPLGTDNGGPDRFAHYLGDNRVVYSHIDGATLGASLWIHEGGAVELLHNETVSDDDAYPDKHDANHIAFVGWQPGGYQFFIYRVDQGDAVRLSRNLPVLAPVLFRQQ